MDIYRKVPAMRFLDMGVVLEGRGLLPEDPLTEFPEDSEFRILDELQVEIPQLLYSEGLREWLEKLPLLPVGKLTGREAALAFLRVAFATSAYVWQDAFKKVDAPQIKIIPKNLAVMIYTLAETLGIPPILLYWIYAMSNWKRLDKSGPIENDNMQLIQHFTIAEYASHESGFILPHVEIEAEAGSGLCAIPRAQLASLENDKTAYIYNMLIKHASFEKIIETLDMIPKVCSPELYYLHVRPGIFFFEDTTYEGIGHFKALKGETGAQSSVIPSFVAALGIKHKHNVLIEHLKKLKKYRPPNQKRWLRAIDRGPSIREFALQNKDDNQIREAYNTVLEDLIKFRKVHEGHAIIYIKEQRRPAVATGGTHYEAFLRELIKETEAHLIH